MALGMLLLALSVSAWQGVTGLLVFFAGFNYLEASLPALVSKVAPESARGRAMGVYSTSQFLGIFVGGSLGGWLLDEWSLSSLLLINALIAVIWMVMLVGLSRVPALQDTRAQGS
jgi:MFS family permease